MPRTLNKMKVGDKGVVSALRGAGSIQQRLLEMGVCPGIEVEVVRFAPLGDPMMIHVRGFLLALRKSEAAMVAVER